VFPFPETVPNFVCHFKGSLHPINWTEPFNPEKLTPKMWPLAFVLRQLTLPTGSAELSEITVKNGGVRYWLEFVG